MRNSSGCLLRLANIGLLVNNSFVMCHRGLLSVIVDIIFQTVRGCSVFARL